VGETRVDLRHLLEDIRDAYTGSLEETIVTEIGAATLAIVDDGHGMKRRELARYHDIATSTKKRGEGIGFAGVGIKLGLLVAREVITETRRGSTHVASRWAMAARHRAPWKWTPPPGMVPSQGTAVQLTLENPLSPLLDGGFLEGVIRQHFEPLLDPRFRTVLGRRYADGVAFSIDGHVLVPPTLIDMDVAPVSFRLTRKRTPSAVGYLARAATPLPAERAGIAVSTLGKVILRGWDWLGLSPAEADRVTGLIEVPGLAECLTLNKSAFLRTGARGATYLAYRKAIQEAVTHQLGEWGETSPEPAAVPRPAKLGRDLERVLEDLASDFPLLHSLVERRRGGQRRLPMPGPGVDDGGGVLLALADSGSAASGPPVVEGPAEAPPSTDVPSAGSGPPAGPTEIATVGESPGSSGIGMTRQRARYGLSLQFESRPEDAELGRLVDSTIWVNRAHPAFTRASGSRALGYHLAMTVALTLAPLAVVPAEEHGFVTRFLAEWGQVEAAVRTQKKARRRI
jgi:hypothetical protein